MKPVSESSPLPSLSQKGSAVPSTAVLPAPWRKTSTKQVKVSSAKEGTACKVHVFVSSMGILSVYLQV
ncbi:hypothetical protein I79_004025 [Cricetulus griseus]|uniref:Uncharacterized protein n=1 Tax=Cricetulus griseus TaxID=10029 RepID=G3H1J7_CRIGR|nr:hypothetical protein I79_004025 [Cricetulus griseus]